MQSFSEYIEIGFGIDFEEFKEFLKKYKIVISGSTALYFYMIQEGMKPNFSPNDLDLYYDYTDEKELEKIIKFIIDYNYESKNNENFYSLNYIPGLFKVFHLERSHHLVKQFSNNINQIQIIVSNKNVLCLIRENFDLNICMCYYDVENDKFLACTPEYIKNYLMYIENEPIVDNLELRIKKYELRGFKLIDKPYSKNYPLIEYYKKKNNKL